MTLQRNKPQHTLKKPSTRNLILQMAPDLMNLPPDKGKGCSEGKHPNNNSPNDRNGPGGSNNDSDGSKALQNSAIACSICKGLSGLFANIDNNKETAWTSNHEPFDGSDANALNAFFTACATMFIGRPKAFKKQCSRITYTLSFL